MVIGRWVGTCLGALVLQRRQVLDLPVCLEADPDQHDDHVETLVVAALVFVTPHAVRRLVPVAARSAVHPAPAAGALLLLGRGGCSRRALGRLLRARA